MKEQSLNMYGILMSMSQLDWEGTASPLLSLGGGGGGVNHLPLSPCGASPARPYARPWRPCIYMLVEGIYATVSGKRAHVAHFFKIELLLP